MSCYLESDRCLEESYPQKGRSFLEAAGSRAPGRVPGTLREFGSKATYAEYSVPARSTSGERAEMGGDFGRKSSARLRREHVDLGDDHSHSCETNAESG